ncbi:MAG TPA: hypothetical protein ENG87_04135 [Candidatus Pacearchaeota archaeon]|nr:hypothetical protein BMS3Abin17_00707 [archaeon BMS3Abin17]HDK42543.1 hypothetical protein [Candidatus Pacearchaeota archaeon]HDZ61097.1 hypothetical protein [Candidatus Pacearchaeota archaeon]
MVDKKAQLKTKKLKTPKLKFWQSQKFPISEIPSFQLSRKKRGQLKIQQMAFMLMAVTLFFVLVGMFVLVIKFSGLKDTATELCEENAMLLVTKLANSPEFSCGRAFGSSRTNCIDGDKVMMLKENIEIYEKFWGVTNIEIRKISDEPEKVCDLGGYQQDNCNVIRLISKNVSGYSMSNFVSLCRKDYVDEEVYDKCEMAKLILSYEYGERC